MFNTLNLTIHTYNTNFRVYKIIITQLLILCLMSYNCVPNKRAIDSLNPCLYRHYSSCSWSVCTVQYRGRGRVATVWEHNCKKDGAALIFSTKVFGKSCIYYKNINHYLIK